MYLDSAYIAKYYVNETDSPAVRRLISEADSFESSAWAVAEVHCVFHRHLREASISEADYLSLSTKFLEHVQTGIWNFTPVTESLLLRTALQIGRLPASVFLRTADAVHLATARESGATEIWTNDRHMLAAAPHFGLIGRSVSQKAPPVG